MTTGTWATDADLTGVVGPAESNYLPPNLRLLLLTDGKRISQVVQVIAELGVADLLAGGPLTATELAAQTGTDPDALGRVLRVAASFGVFTQLAHNTYEINDLAQGLRSNTPNSQRELVLFNGDDMLTRSYQQLMYTVRTGKPAFPQVFGSSFFDYLTANPQKARLFDAAMMQMSRTTGALLLAQYDFAALQSVVDVGGGTGLFLSRLLQEYPAMHGVLFDLPDVVTAADPAVDRLGERFRIVGGDFFGPIPAGHDGYLLKAVLHDWNDDDAITILSRIREAMTSRPDSRLLICEFLVGPGNQWDRGKLLDLDMMLRFGGRERDRNQWIELLGRAGFCLTNDPPDGRWAVLECRPTRNTQQTNASH